MYTAERTALNIFVFLAPNYGCLDDERSQCVAAPLRTLVPNIKLSRGCILSNIKALDFRILPSEGLRADEKAMKRGGR